MNSHAEHGNEVIRFQRPHKRYHAAFSESEDLGVRKDMKGLAINNQMLHDVRMPMRQDYHNGLCSISYPKSRIFYDIKEGQISLKIPSFLALELFRKGYISQDSDAQFPVSLSGKKIGMFRLADLRYPDTGDNITITLVKV